MHWKERRENERDFRLELIKQGKTADEIDQLLTRKRTLTSRERGMDSEQRVIEALKLISFVADVVKANRQDDNEGTDLWVSFDPDSKHRNIPIQVKSSWTGFLKFLSHKGREERRVILVVKPETSTTTIRRTFLAKLKGFDGFI